MNTEAETGVTQPAPHKCRGHQEPKESGRCRPRNLPGSPAPPTLDIRLLASRPRRECISFVLSHREHSHLFQQPQGMDTVPPSQLSGWVPADVLRSESGGVCARACVSHNQGQTHRPCSVYG